MPYLSPQTLTRAEQQALLEASSAHPRDHLIFSLALGTGLTVVGNHRAERRGCLLRRWQASSPGPPAP